MVSIHPNIDTSLVRYGDISKFSTERNDKVATIDSKRIYAKIPSYILIKKEKVKQGSARYHELMTKATREYKLILKQVAMEKNFVLIVENGGVHNYKFETATKMCIEKI